jgi:hypothetical protein
MPLLFDQKIRVESKHVTYDLIPADDTDEPYSLGAIRLIMSPAGERGWFRVTDNLTPEQADEMAAAFTEVARRARIANGIEVEATPEEIAAFERKLAAAKGDTPAPSGSADFPLPEGFELPPVFAEMQAIIDATPGGEGSRFDRRSSFAWEMVETYRTADEPDTIAEFVEDITTGDQVRACVLRDVARAVNTWAEQDRTSTVREAA